MKHTIRTGIAAAILSAATLLAAPLSAQDDWGPHLGEIRFFAGNFAPSGWSLCDGQMLAINAETQALFEVLGTTYGGDGVTSFALPDMRGRTPIHAGAIENAQPQPGDSGGDTLNTAPFDPAVITGRDTPHWSALTCLIATAPAYASPYTMLGEVRFVAFNFAMRGWELCNGQLLPITQHLDLFSLLGTTYGGDGRMSFGNWDQSEPLENIDFKTVLSVGETRITSVSSGFLRMGRPYLSSKIKAQKFFFPDMNDWLEKIGKDKQVGRKDLLRVGIGVARGMRNGSPTLFSVVLLAR